MLFLKINIQKIKQSLRTAILLFILLCSTTFSLINTDVASAANADSFTPEQQAKSISYYVVLGRCIEDRMQGDIYLKAVDGDKTTPTQGIGQSQGEWFNGGDAWGIVYPDGRKDCVDILKDALNLWGWGSDYTGFLKDMGYTYQPDNTPPRYHGPGDDAGNGTTRRNYFNSAVSTKLWGEGSFKSPLDSGNEAWYHLYLKAFSNDPCGAQDAGLYSSLNPSLKSLVDKNGKEGDRTYTKVTIANGSKTEEHGFSFLEPEGSMAVLYGYRASGSEDKIGKWVTCSEAAKKVSETAPGYAAWKRANPDKQDNVPIPGQISKCKANPKADGCTKEEKSSCAVEGVGWIVCPVASFLGMLTDGLFGVLTTLLSFTPVQSNGATYDTWQTMRNIANAAFVIAFLVIIFSQLTGAGINNYGIKKMVPRLIAAAILVNVSYFICQIAVDLSNITGYSLQSLMTKAANSTSGSANNLDVWGDLVGWILAGAGTGLAVGGVTLSVLGAGGWIPALALLLPVLITVLFAVFTVVLVLAARQALIIILIVISPLAFVAYLLPNTEDWFHKWRKLFTTLLLMFPIISVIFGGSQLAAAVIRAGTNNPLIYILSLAVQVIPFFLVPIIMKTAGGLLNRFGGIVNNPNRGPIDKLRKRAEGYAGYKVNDAMAKNMKYKGDASRFSFVGRARRRAERDSIYSSADNRAKEAGVEYIGRQLTPDSEGNPTNAAFARKMAGSNDDDALNMVMARGASAVDEIEAKELKAAQVILSNARVDGANLLKLSGGEDGTGLNGQKVKGSAIMQMAASASLFAQGRQMDTVVENLLTSAHDPRNAADKERILSFTVGQIQSSYPKAKEKQVALTDESLMQSIADGSVTADNLKAALKVSAAKKAVDLSVDFMASQEASSLTYIEGGIGGLEAPKAEKIQATSLKVTQTPSAVAKTNEETYRIIKGISEGSGMQITGQGTLF